MCLPRRLSVSPRCSQVIQLPEATGFGRGGSMLLSGLVMAPFGVVIIRCGHEDADLTGEANRLRKILQRREMSAEASFEDIPFVK